MRTNIVLNDKLVKHAQKITGVKTKREVVDLALQELINSRKRLDVRKLFAIGGIRQEYDYKSLRRGR